MKSKTHCSHTEQRPIGELKPHPRNPNTHSAGQLKLLAKIIEAQGWRNPIVVSNRSGLIVAGHARLEAAKLLGMETVPVDVQTFKDTDAELAHLLADNRIAELAEMDGGSLKDLILEMDTGALDMDLTGYDHGALEELMTQFHVDEENDAEPKIDQAEELQAKWGTKLGQIWELGDHRIACGDCTDEATIERVMDGARAEAIITDPPYGLGMDGRKESKAKNPKHNRKGFPFMGWDECRPPKEWFALIAAQDCPTVIFGGNYFADLLPPSRGWIYWGKGQDGCLTASDGELAWSNLNKPLRAVTVNRASLSGKTAHPTQKPLSVITFAMNYAGNGQVIYDPFLGSGTTLIACENLGRKCRAIELAPEYVAVSIQRWVDVTGKEPRQC